jgi:hypothetical protein
MRTKTMLLGAAVLAAGLASSLAANVYSVNVVGYYNVTVPAGKEVLLANQLTGTGATSNAASTQITGNFPSGCNLFVWNGLSFTLYTYYDAADAAPDPAGFYDINGNYSTVPLNQGIGAFFQNASNGPATIQVVGQVVQGSNAVPIQTGFQPLSIPCPVSTNFADTTIVNFVDNNESGDLLEQWIVGSQTFSSPYTYYDAADAAPDPAGWYDINGNYATPTPAVGEAFFLSHVGAATNWNFFFTVPQN